mgnify:CR=1 FL=1
MADLPEFDSVRRCPKCGLRFDLSGGYLGGVEEVVPHMKHRFGNLATAKDAAAQVENLARFSPAWKGMRGLPAIPEHMERTCPRCSFWWIEQLPKLDQE